MKRLYLIYIIWWNMLLLHAQPIPENSVSQLRPGDLLFIATTESNAITDVTQGYGSAHIDHVAICYAMTDSIVDAVIEAIPDSGVCVTTIDGLLERCRGEKGSAQVMVGKVTSDIDIAQSLQNALSLVGKPYDDLFLADYKAIYCSELVQKSYVDHEGRLIFDPIPMSFHDESGCVTEFWKAHYRAHDMQVPEGAPGTNPGELSRRDNVRIVFKLRNEEQRPMKASQ